jgi:hypothetical protein
MLMITIKSWFWYEYWFWGEDCKTDQPLRMHVAPRGLEFAFSHPDGLLGSPKALEVCAGLFRVRRYKPAASHQTHKPCQLFTEQCQSFTESCQMFTE